MKKILLILALWPLGAIAAEERQGAAQQPDAQLSLNSSALNTVTAASSLDSRTVAQTETVAPDVLVRNTANEVLELIKQDRGVRHISEIIDEKVIPHFDLDRMSRIAFGKDWNDIAKEQQDTFLQEFHKLITHTFASALSIGHGDSIRTKPLSIQPGDSETSVNMLIAESGKDEDSVAFRMAKVGNEWKVYDLSSEGISFLATYRSQFTSVKQQVGVDGLIQKLRVKNM